MKSTTARILLREPLKAKNWIRRGAKVQAMENGHPRKAEEKRRRQAVDGVLDQLLRETKSSISLSQIIKQSRQFNYSSRQTHAMGELQELKA